MSRHDTTGSIQVRVPLTCFQARLRLDALKKSTQNKMITTFSETIYFNLSNGRLFS